MGSNVVIVTRECKAQPQSEALYLLEISVSLHPLGSCSYRNVTISLSTTTLWHGDNIILPKTNLSMDINVGFGIEYVVMLMDLCLDLPRSHVLSD